MKRALMVQLARLGDLLQTLPAIASMKATDRGLTLDLLCPAPLAPIGRMLPGVTDVVEWDGLAWNHCAEATGLGLQLEHLQDADRRINMLAPRRYDCAYVLNQHPRALLAGAILAKEIRGSRLHGPLDTQLAPWASYVRDVAATRRGCRVHLADAFCGLCGVHPLGVAPALERKSCSLPEGLEPVGKQGGPWIGLIVGAGAVERLVPLEVWRRWIMQWLDAAPSGRVVLLGQERERGRRLHDLMPASTLGRLWDATGRTALHELAELLSRCHAVIGADTGPLHLAAALGIRAIGWYFARARVHETGPYGIGHLVWQADGTKDGTLMGASGVQPLSWPVEETVAALVKGRIDRKEGWTVWDSHCDRWGAYFSEADQSPAPPREREELWSKLSSNVR